MWMEQEHCFDVFILMPANVFSALSRLCFSMFSFHTGSRRCHVYKSYCIAWICSSVFLWRQYLVQRCSTSVSMGKCGTVSSVRCSTTYSTSRSFALWQTLVTPRASRRSSCQDLLASDDWVHHSKLIPRVLCPHLGAGVGLDNWRSRTKSRIAQARDREISANPPPFYPPYLGDLQHIFYPPCPQTQNQSEACEHLSI